MGDYDRSAEACARFGASIPIDRWCDLLNTCLRAAIAIGDKAAEDKYEKRFLEETKACGHGDLADFLLDYTCRTEEALREASLSIDEGCGESANAARRRAMLRLHRFAEAAEPPLDGKYFTGVHAEWALHPEIVNGDRNNRALALAMTDREMEARALLEPVRSVDLRSQILWGMLDQGILKERVDAAVGCGLSTEKSERLGAAGGYVQWQIFEDARPLLDQAIALNPKSPRAWANRVYLASVAGNLKEAVALGEQALGLGIDDPYLAGNLGYVYQQLGQCDKAIPLFQRKLIGQPWTAPNYTNLAKCYDAVGRDKEAAAMWGYVLGGKPRTFWWMYVVVIGAAIGLYIGGKLALIKLAPRRFGHLKFP